MANLNPALAIEEQRYRSNPIECKSPWVATYFFLREVDDNDLWRWNYKSFHAWLQDYCKRNGLKSYPVFRRRLKAGLFYDETIYQGRAGFFPPIEDLEVSAESIIEVEKIFELDKEAGINTLTDLIMRTIGRKDLDVIYRAVVGREKDEGGAEKDRGQASAAAFETDIENSVLRGLSQAELRQVLADKKSWVYSRIVCVLGDDATFDITSSAQALIASRAFEKDRGEQDLWEVLSPYVYKAKDADEKRVTLSVVQGGLVLQACSACKSPAIDAPSFDMPSTIRKRGPKPQPWYDRNTARLIDSLVRFKVDPGLISSDLLHRLAEYLSGGPGDDGCEPLPEDRSAAHLLWFAMLGMTVACGYVGVNGEITLGSIHGVIEHGNKLLAGTTTRLDYLFYSTAEEGREGYEQRLYKGHIELTRLAVEALSSYRRYRELTLKQRERAAAVAASLLTQALLDGKEGETEVPKELENIVEGVCGA